MKSHNILENIIKTKACRYKNAHEYKELSDKVVNEVTHLFENFSEDFKKEIDRFTWEEVTIMVQAGNQSVQYFYQNLHIHLSKRGFI